MNNKRLAVILFYLGSSFYIPNTEAVGFNDLDSDLLKRVNKLLSGRDIGRCGLVTKFAYYNLNETKIFLSARSFNDKVEKLKKIREAAESEKDIFKVLENPEIFEEIVTEPFSEVEKIAKVAFKSEINDAFKLIFERIVQSFNQITERFNPHDIIDRISVLLTIVGSEYCDLPMLTKAYHLALKTNPTLICILQKIASNPNIDKNLTELIFNKVNPLNPDDDEYYIHSDLMPNILSNPSRFRSDEEFINLFRLIEMWKPTLPLPPSVITVDDFGMAKNPRLPQDIWENLFFHYFNWFQRKHREGQKFKFVLDEKKLSTLKALISQESAPIIRLEELIRFGFVHPYTFAIYFLKDLTKSRCGKKLIIENFKYLVNGLDKYEEAKPIINYLSYIEGLEIDEIDFDENVKKLQFTDKKRVLLSILLEVVRNCKYPNSQETVLFHFIIYSLDNILNKEGIDYLIDILENIENQYLKKTLVIRITQKLNLSSDQLQKLFKLGNEIMEDDEWIDFQLAFAQNHSVSEKEAFDTLKEVRKLNINTTNVVDERLVELLDNNQIEELIRIIPKKESTEINAFLLNALTQKKANSQELWTLAKGIINTDQLVAFHLAFIKSKVMSEETSIWLLQRVRNIRKGTIVNWEKLPGSVLSKDDGKRPRT